jgi:hypothetical protein
MKGRRGWASDSRRSLSWLIYLCDADWTLQENGGALRVFPQQRRMARASGPCGASDTDLQYGWLVQRTEEGEGDGGEVVKPVFLDCWKKQDSSSSSSGGEEEKWPVYKAGLFIHHSEGDGGEGGGREYVTADFELHDPGTGRAREDLHAELLPALARAGGRILRLEDIALWDRGELPDGCVTFVDQSPTGATLVVFDSVALPHEVLRTLKGDRVALAGWFHERSQTIPGL